MATVHIESKKEDIANIVLMPGDPKRAQYIADKFLTDVKLVTIPEKFKGNVDLANIDDIVKKDLEK